MSIFTKRGRMEIDNQAKDILVTTVLSSAGFAIADNNKDMIPKLKKWYALFNAAEMFDTKQNLFNMFIEMVSDKFIEKPFLKLQFKNAMELVKISYEGPMLEADLEKYQKFVDGFMMGVEAVEVE